MFVASLLFNRVLFVLFYVLAAVVGYGLEWLHLPHGLLLGTLLSSALVGWVWRTRRKPVAPTWVLPLIQVVLGVSTGLLF